MRLVQSQDDLASQRREGVGKLLEDRSKAVIAKAISEATKAVDMASAEAQSYTAGGREGSDGKLSSRMSSPIEQVREVNRSEITVFRRGGRESEHVARHHAKHEESESDDDDEESGEDEAKKAATRDNQKRSSRDRERRKNRRKFKSKLNDELFIVSTATEIQGQEMMIMKHVNFKVQGDRAVRQGHNEQGEDRESTPAVRCETHHRGKLQPASPEASKNRCRCPAAASRWHGHQGKNNDPL